MDSPSEPRVRPFQFERDTFTFANETVWKYHFEKRTGKMSTSRNPRPPAYSHRCFVMVRSARQFLYHAHFALEQPRADEPTYRRLVREVVSRTPRQADAARAPVVIPGYDCLRAFSGEWEWLLKATLGKAWESYFVRSHWRMVAPTWRRHQERMARQLLHSFAKRPAPIVHLYRFPHITINHGIVLFGVTEAVDRLQFAAYDPNIPQHPVPLIYERAARTFSFPQNHYWAGGPLNVYEMYTGGLY